MKLWKLVLVYEYAALTFFYTWMASANSLESRNGTKEPELHTLLMESDGYLQNKKNARDARSRADINIKAADESKQTSTSRLPILADWCLTSMDHCLHLLDLRNVRKALRHLFNFQSNEILLNSRCYLL